MAKISFSANARRKAIQLTSALLYNANLKGFITGDIFKGQIKGVCVPGLNCYSCPGAVGSCPLGSLQMALSTSNKGIPYYVLGLLVLFSALFGRLICAFLCPFGLIQELLFKIPTRKLKKSSLTRKMSWVKYGILIVFCIALPLYYFAANGVGSPAFCKFICPAGTLTAGIPLLLANSSLQSVIGPLFYWKLTSMLAILLGAVFIYRIFCRFLCPLGAIYSLFNRVAIFGIRVDESKCTHCNACVNTCKMDVKRVNDRECIRCGECRSRCAYGALCTTKSKKRNEPS